jgi:hypothetical protein
MPILVIPNGAQRSEESSLVALADPSLRSSQVKSFYGWRPEAVISPHPPAPSPTRGEGGIAF